MTLLLSFIPMVSGCSDETHDPLPREGSFTQNGATLNYSICYPYVSAGDDLQVKLTKTGEGSLTSIIVFDGEQIETDTYPYVWTHRVSTKGSYPLTIGTGIYVENEGWMLDTNLCITTNITIK